MKKTLLTALSLVVASFAIAQTNTFPITGNVGIGTIGPLESLDIRGNIGYGVYSGSEVYIKPSNNNFGGVIKVKQDATTTNRYVQLGYQNNSGVYTAVLHVGTDAKVGIGTTSPSQKLSITDGQIYLGQTTSNLFESGRIRFTESNGTKYQGAFIHYNGDVNVLNIGVHDAYDTETSSDVNAVSILRSNSYVGIGTISPNAKLHVQVGASGETFSNLRGLLVENSGSSNNYYVFQAATTGGGKFFSLTNAGNVGIGTTDPQNKLDVRGDCYINSGVDDNHIYWGLHYMTMGTKPGDYCHNYFSLKPGGSSSGKLYSIFRMYNANSETDHELKVQIHTNGVTFFNGGNVGIGTINPGNYKLAVEGTIGAREVKVTTDAWADFVFQPAYKLRTLGEVEQYVKVNNHLPDVPSESEVKENGVSLGEMNAKLLQKVEELTLYLIEQQKKIDSQNAKIQELEKQNQRIDELEKQINSIINSRL